MDFAPTRPAPGAARPPMVPGDRGRRPPHPVSQPAGGRGGSSGSVRPARASGAWGSRSRDLLVGSAVALPEDPRRKGDRTLSRAAPSWGSSASPSSSSRKRRGWGPAAPVLFDRLSLVLLSASIVLALRRTEEPGVQLRHQS